MIRLSAPLIYSLEITAACDSMCPGCGNVFEHSASGELSLGEWEIITGKIRPFAGEIRVTGGEPTLHPRFFEILTLLEESALPFHIFTNGRWPDTDEMTARLKGFTRLGSVLVSLHGARPETHNVFSINTTAEIFERIGKNISALSAAKIPVNTNTVMGAFNLPELEDIAALSASLGAANAAFARYVGPPSAALGFSREELKSALHRLENLRRSGLPVILGNCIPNCFYPSNASGCLAGASFCTIDPFGNMRPCNHAPGRYGNLLRDGVKKIWNGPRMKEWAAHLPGECEECAFNAICPGGCRAAREITGASKDPLLDGPACLPPGRPEKPPPVTLEENLRPRPLFKVRREPFGLALISRGRFLPVEAGAAHVLRKINGKTTLKDIKKDFGDEGLVFICRLAHKGFVEFLR
jgi:radical SAM protein with 4Fe4S-binding SPASM domain